MARAPRLPERTQPVVRLLSCRACRRFIRPREVTCPFCGADVAEAFNAWAAKKAELASALAAIDAIFAGKPEAQRKPGRAATRKAKTKTKTKSARPPRR